MGTMGDPGGRYAAYTARLVDGVLAAPGDTPGALRRAVLERAGGSGGKDIPPAIAAYVDKVARHAYKVTDEDVAGLLEASWTQDQVFELTLATALGEGRRRIDVALAALEEA